MILHWSPRLGLNYAFSRGAQPSDRTECIHGKVSKEQKGRNFEPVCLTTIAIWGSWKSTLCCTERQQCARIKYNKKGKAQVFKFGSFRLSGYGFNRKKKEWILSTLCLDRWQAKPRVTHSATFFSHLPSLSVLQQPEASWKTMSTLKCASSRQQAASELKQEGVDKQAAWMSAQPSVGSSDSSCDIVCPAVTTLTTSSIPTHHSGTPPSRSRVAIKICSASARN